jgi:hypothetical protein
MTWTPSPLGGRWRPLSEVPLAPVDVSLPLMIVMWLLLFELVTEDGKLVELSRLVWFVALSC